MGSYYFLFLYWNCHLLHSNIISHKFCIKFHQQIIFYFFPSVILDTFLKTKTAYSFASTASRWRAHFCIEVRFQYHMFWCFHLILTELFICWLFWKSVSRFDINTFEVGTEVLSFPAVFLWGAYVVPFTLFLRFIFSWIESDAGSVLGFYVVVSHADHIFNYRLFTGWELYKHAMCNDH